MMVNVMSSSLNQKLLANDGSSVTHAHAFVPHSIAWLSTPTHGAVCIILFLFQAHDFPHERP
jgi:hypothetical protein